MSYCAIKSCKNNKKKVNKSNGDVTYHKLPKDSNIKGKWIAATGQDENWYPTPRAVICSDHFDHKCFLENNGRRFLKNASVPTLKLTPYSTCSTSRETSNEVSQELRDLIQNFPSENNPSTATSLKQRERENTDLKATLKLTPYSTCSTSRETSKKVSQELRDLIQNFPCENNPSTATSLKQRERENTDLKASLLKLEREKRYYQELAESRRKKIRATNAKNLKLKKKINSMQALLNILHAKFNLESQEIDILQTLNVTLKDIMGRHSYCLKNKEKKFTKKFSPALRAFCLTLSYYSPKAYRYVRKIFGNCLPHPRTIVKWYESINGDPGFLKEALLAIKIKCQNANHPIYATLIMDEMAIKQKVEWDASNKRYNGYVDFGADINHGDSTPVAKEALVFMVVGINCYFKIPVAYFLINSITANQKATLIKRCLSHLKSTNIIITSFTCDAPPVNIRTLSILGCDFSDDQNIISTFYNPYSENNETNKIAVFLDACHMLKLIRNALYTFHENNTELICSNKKVSWAYLDMLNKIQNTEWFHLGNKLSNSHINFQKNIMKVRLASQLFSKSVSEAMLFCQNDLKLTEFQNAAGTIEFVELINDLFDVFNSRNLYQKHFKRPLNTRNKDEIFELFEKVQHLFRNLQIREKNHDQITEKKVLHSARKTGFLGFLVCIQSAIYLYETLIETGKLIYFPFYKASQDNLELLFFNIRSHGGSNNNPTSRQLKAIIKKILVHTELIDGNTGNAVALESVPILHAASSSYIKRINSTTNTDFTFDEDRPPCNSNETESLFAENLTVLSEFATQSISYIAGFVVKSLSTKLKCEECISAMISHERTDEHILVCRKDRGTSGACLLTYASKDVIFICNLCEKLIRKHMTLKLEGRMKLEKTQQYILNSILQACVSKDLFASLTTHQFNQDVVNNHVILLIKAIASKYIDTRLFFLAKSKDSLGNRQKFNKIVLFSGE